MRHLHRARVVALAAALVGAWIAPGAAQAPQGPIKIGVMLDHTGPFAAAGSLASYRGTELAIDMVYEKGGVLGKHRLQQIDADSQSKAEVAINEAERLLNAEKVDLLVGIYSSAHAVPLAEKVDRQKKFRWITSAISDAVFKGRNLRYTFRAQANSGKFGEVSVQYVAAYCHDRLGKAPKDLRVAIIYEDGPYGTGVGTSNEAEAKRQGMQVVLREGYSAQSPDLSSLVTKLRAARPDVLLHTGYNPDITLFLRQSKELGFRVKAMIGHGAGHSQIDKLHEAFGSDVDYIHTVDPVAAQLLDPKKLRPGLADLVAAMVRRYKALYGEGELPPHVSMGFNNTWVLLNDVLPRAIKKYGGWGPDALASAARDTDIPEGGTLQGYGVKFYPPGHEMAGQNLRAFPVVYQAQGGRFEIVYPKSVPGEEPRPPAPRLLAVRRGIGGRCSPLPASPSGSGVAPPGRALHLGPGGPQHGAGRARGHRRGRDGRRVGRDPRDPVQARHHRAVGGADGRGRRRVCAVHLVREPRDPRDWHPAPRRQYIINLDAGVRITASDGESRVIGAGEVILVEDTTGKGHLSKAVDDRLRHCIFVPVDER